MMIILLQFHIELIERELRTFFSFIYFIYFLFVLLYYLKLLFSRGSQCCLSNEYKANNHPLESAMLL